MPKNNNKSSLKGGEDPTINEVEKQLNQITKSKINQESEIANLKKKLAEYTSVVQIQENRIQELKKQKNEIEAKNTTNQQNAKASLDVIRKELKKQIENILTSK